jgi:hypothetical protein
MSGPVRDLAEIELRNHSVPFRPILQLQGLQAFIDELTRNAEIVEHIKRRRMECRCPGFSAEIVAGLEHRDGNSLAHQLSRGNETDGPCPRNQNAIFDHIRPAAAVRLLRNTRRSLMNNPQRRPSKFPRAIKPDRSNGSPSAYNRFPT